jgi:hypothetical protein
VKRAGSSAAKRDRNGMGCRAPKIQRQAGFASGLSQKRNYREYGVLMSTPIGTGNEQLRATAHDSLPAGFQTGFQALFVV